MEDFENSHSSPVQEAESSAGTSSDGEPSVPSSETPTPQAYSSPDRMTDFSRLSRSGMTFAPLTDDRGEDVLTWFLAGFRAKTSAQPGEVQGSRASGRDSGERWPASLAKYDHDSRSWRTHQYSLLGGLIEFSETWPRWGTMRGGECWGVDTPVALCDETGYGYLPAVVASDGTQHGKEKWIANSRAKRKANGKSPPTERITYAYYEAGIPTRYFPEISEDVMGWPIGWTDLGALATDKFQQWRHSHGGFCPDDARSGTTPGDGSSPA